MDGYSNPNANKIDEFFGYNYFINVRNNNEVTRSSEYFNSAPRDIRELIEMYREEHKYGFNPKDADFEDYNIGWNASRTIGKKPNPWLLDYSIMSWVLKGTYDNLLAEPTNAIKYNYQHNLLTHEEMCRMIRNSFTLNDWLKEAPRVNDEEGLYVYFGGPKTETYNKIRVTPPGEIVKITGFLSTSLSPNSAYRFSAGVFYRIHIPQRSILPFISDIKNRYGELEVLLPFSSIFRMETIENITDAIESPLKTDLINLTFLGVDPPEQSPEFYCASTGRFFERLANEPRKSYRIKSKILKSYKNIPLRKTLKSNIIPSDLGKGKRRSRRSRRSRRRRTRSKKSRVH
jgi:hypothetical protein